MFFNRLVLENLGLFHGAIYVMMKKMGISEFRTKYGMLFEPEGKLADEGLGVKYWENVLNAAVEFVHVS
jgi:hypothetical protein